MKIQSFTQLRAWQEAHQMVIAIYKASATFPVQEQYGLTNQIRRAAVSVTSNIAEGFSRQSQKEKVQFYHTAKGSLTEVQNQLLIARDVGYLERELFSRIAEQTVQSGRLITGIIKSARTKL